MTLTESQLKQIERMDRDGYTQDEIADVVGCSQSTVSTRVSEIGGLRFEMSNHYECVMEKNPSRPVYLHRLLAAVDHSLDELEGKHVHHKNGFEWDNRPDNIEVLSVSDHMKEHSA